MGQGALNLRTGSATDKTAFGNETDFRGTKVKDLSAIGYSVFTTGENRATAPNNMPSITFEIDPNVVGSGNYTSLVYAPDNSAPNAWTPIDAKNDSGKHWGLTGSFFNARPDRCGINSGRCTFDEVLTYLSANNNGPGRRQGLHRPDHQGPRLRLLRRRRRPRDRRHDLRLRADRRPRHQVGRGGDQTFEPGSAPDMGQSQAASSDGAARGTRGSPEDGAARWMPSSPIGSIHSRAKCRERPQIHLPPPWRPPQASGSAAEVVTVRAKDAVGRYGEDVAARHLAGRDVVLEPQLAVRAGRDRHRRPGRRRAGGLRGQDPASTAYGTPLEAVTRARRRGCGGSAARWLAERGLHPRARPHRRGRRARPERRAASVEHVRGVV